MKRLSLALPWLFAAACAQAAAPPSPLHINGAADSGAPGWILSTLTPAGWTADCCKYARAIGVQEVIYRGDWSGEPDQVMVLNVWPRKLASLEAEWREDQQRYRQHDPAGVISPLDWHDARLDCRGFRYQGGDKVDDLVVFCDPGAASGIRLSWSMAIGQGVADRDAVIASFRQVVEATTYQLAAKAPVSAKPALAH